MQSIENNAKYFTLLVGNHVRFTVLLYYPSWTESYFDLQGDWSPDEYLAVYAAINRLAANRYQDYKLNAYNHLKAHGPSRPYGEMSIEDWQKCIDFFTSPNFMDKLVELRETQQTQVAFSGTSLDERAIVNEILGERRGHIRGIGWVPNGTSPSLDSITASKAPQGTSHQFFGDPRMMIFGLLCMRLNCAKCNRKLNF
ncbi:hypothetical protein Adt_21489 [Abeliophyllum distichum]|uniref:Transposase n=1 Tax=Abeliophyllum distichum TaxID=126358 RepID=A0ABD1SZN0_9LAMI